MFFLCRRSDFFAAADHEICRSFFIEMKAGASMFVKFVVNDFVLNFAIRKTGSKSYRSTCAD